MRRSGFESSPRNRKEWKSFHMPTMLEVDPEVALKIQARARERGVSVDVYLRELVDQEGTESNSSLNRTRKWRSLSCSPRKIRPRPRSELPPALDTAESSTPPRHGCERAVRFHTFRASSQIDPDPISTARAGARRTVRRVRDAKRADR